ncbi:hypothetical protein [Pseudoduganella sp. UC29_71]|uniref:hypothetical protein n=1 Tax=Pseudoduganella sp. UC29_71 TaxID=3350174 RepID=UPI0036725BCA
MVLATPCVNVSAGTTLHTGGALAGTSADGPLLPAAVVGGGAGSDDGAGPAWAVPAVALPPSAARL